MLGNLNFEVYMNFVKLECIIVDVYWVYLIIDVLEENFNLFLDCYGIWSWYLREDNDCWIDEFYILNYFFLNWFVDVIVWVVMIVSELIDFCFGSWINVVKIIICGYYNLI